MHGIWKAKKIIMRSAGMTQCNVFRVINRCSAKDAVTQSSYGINNTHVKVNIVRKNVRLYFCL